MLSFLSIQTRKLILVIDLFNRKVNISSLRHDHGLSAKRYAMIVPFAHHVNKFVFSFRSVHFSPHFSFILLRCLFLSS